VVGENSIVREPYFVFAKYCEDEMAIEKLKRHSSPGTDQIRAELIKAGGGIIRSEIHKLIISIWNKEELPEEWQESVIVAIY
jgi:hypothetical protein